MTRLRILDHGVAQFPTWWPRAAVESVFALVSGRPDALVMPMPDWRWQPSDFAAATQLAEVARVPTAVYDRFDSWDDPARAWRGEPAFADHLHRYCARATMVAGPQLPRVDGPAHPLPLPYPPLVPRVPSPPDLSRSELDVAFAGAFSAPGWAGPPTDSRDRHHRGHLLAGLEQGLGTDRVVIRQTRYWTEDGDGQAQLRRRSCADADRAAIVFAPAGFGYLTFRHADGWARGRAVLSEPVTRHTLVPEPERWEQGDVALVYEPDGRDLVAVVTAALRRPAELAAVARAGWEYGDRWARPEIQTRLLAEALGGHRG